MIKTRTFRFNSLISIYFFIQCIVLPAYLYAERPMFTDDPNVSPHRVLTLELGNHFDVLRSAERPARYINWFDIMIVYGIAANYEVSVHVPAGLLLYESGAPDRSKFGSDDLSVAIKRVWHGFDEMWGFGIEGGVSFPIESSPVLGSDRESFWINTMGDYGMNGWILRGSLGFMAPFDTFDEGSVMTGIAARTDIHDAHFGFIELYTEAPVSSTGEEFPLGLMFGGGLGIFDNTIFDLGILIGLTNSSVFPGTGIHAGLTIEI